MLHKTFSFRIISIYLTQFFQHKIKFENPKLEFHSRVPLKIRFWRGLGLNTLIFQLFKSKESITLEVLLWINEEQRETRKMGNETPEATERMSDVVVMSQGFYCKKNTNTCIRANPWHLHKACSQTSALSHSAAQLSWYPHGAGRRAESSSPPLPRHSTTPPDTLGSLCVGISCVSTCTGGEGWRPGGRRENGFGPISGCFIPHKLLGLGWAPETAEDANSTWAQTADCSWSPQLRPTTWPWSQSLLIAKGHHVLTKVLPGKRM